MELYNFTLSLSGVQSKTEGLADAIYDHGCDDALVFYHRSSVYVEFDREAESLHQAIKSAVYHIESANIGAFAISVDSVLVGLSDVAELSDATRQAITFLKNGSCGKEDFPDQTLRISGQSSLLDWSEVACWLNNCDRLGNIDKSTRERLVLNAKTLSKWNLALRLRALQNLEDIDAIEKIAHSLPKPNKLNNSIKNG